MDEASGSSMQFPSPVAKASADCDLEGGGAGENCVICFDAKDKPEEVCILSCGHTYHVRCANENFRKLYISNLDITCPLCRLVLQEKTTVEYVMTRLEIMRTLPKVQITSGPPTRIMLPNNDVDTCFIRTLLCFPLVLITIFMIIAFTLTSR
jgi:hypothetical protein